ncbi:hypothetical protein BmR1_04g05510 [Babesia microti strain RI]|uniref:Uncharacterized protein n=1 Tax=Babesia microti (strain RI) TaxID=1133968 RepID=I7JCL9_BABMR|nr:hypothetical protein BmR1_04g05510 [Babesia microti strain RI]CCF75300.1 hypothetical protein BmR1_04g05510 [Babesia microti strain RI]|eukprot:XP_012649708.1 hypothetical protein BmR1_04g05510 [Babesia microti strain RI]
MSFYGRTDLPTPNGYRYSYQVGPDGTDFGTFTTDIFVNLQNQYSQNNQKSQGFNLNFDSEEVLIVIDSVKTYAMKIMLYFYLGGVQTLSGFIFSLHGIGLLLDDIINISIIFWKKLNHMYMDELMLYLTNYLILVAIFLAYLWDCDRQGLFKYVPDYCKTNSHNLYARYTTVFAEVSK